MKSDFCWLNLKAVLRDNGIKFNSETHGPYTLMIQAEGKCIYIVYKPGTKIKPFGSVMTDDGMYHHRFKGMYDLLQRIVDVIRNPAQDCIAVCR